MSGLPLQLFREAIQPESKSMGPARSLEGEPRVPTPTPIEFGTDGWRAIIAEDFTFDNVRICAQAVADWLHQEGRAGAGLVVGYDTRFASDRFAEAVAEVAAANDVPVFLCNRPEPTPVISYSVKDRQAGGGVVITSSHNP